ncbi:MAG TPA: alpha/beta hydrolase, partial [Beijerinckiaceae bacterium]|nr:alpha/beta hydrolase [Beijerinckiaceae bacterium]
MPPAIPDAPAARILFLHGSLSSGRMWAPYAARFGGLAPDLLGYGRAPDRPGDRLRLADEARAVLAEAPAEPVDVVAHSYGATVALRLAILAPHRVRSLCLIEPVAFYLLPHLGPRARAALREVEDVARTMRRNLALGEPEAAVARFVDFWNGPGAFAASPPQRRAAFAARAGRVVRDFAAIEAERLAPAALSRLFVPTLVVLGDRGPPAPVIAGEAIARAMPRASAATVRGAGHM